MNKTNDNDFPNSSLVKENNSLRHKKAIIILIASAFLTALLGLLIKKINNIPIMEIVFFRNLGIIFVAPILLWKNSIPMLGNNKTFLLIRSFTGFIAISSMYFAYSNMLLGDAVTIKELFPIFVLILSTFFLKEKIFWKQIPLIFLAFIGVVMIIKPGLNSYLLPSMIALNGSFFFSISQVILRHLRHTDHPLVIINYLGYTNGILGLAIILLQKSFVFPDTKNLILLISIAIIALIASYGFAKAYSMAQASFLSFYMYSEIIFATMLGILFLEEIPDVLSILGALLIILTGIMNFKIKLKYEQEYLECFLE